MPTTARMRWIYAVESQKDWWDTWVAFMNQIDGDVYGSIEDPALKLQGGGQITLNTGTDELTWTEDLELVNTLTGAVATIAAGTLAGFSIGKIAYIDISRPFSSNRTAILKVTSTLGVDLSKTFIALRKDSLLYMRNSLEGTPAITHRVEHTTANVTSGGGIINGEIDLGVSSGFFTGWIKAIGNTVDSSIVFYADVGLTDQLAAYSNEDMYAAALELRGPLQTYALDGLTARKLYYKITNDGASDSTYILKLNPIGAK